MPQWYLYRKPQKFGAGYTVHVRTSEGGRGYFIDNQDGTVTYRRMVTLKPRDYNRFRVEEALGRTRSQSLGAPVPRSYGTHPATTRKPPVTGRVSYCSRTLREHTRVMKLATGKDSATDYAHALGRPAYMRFEWCHLVAHGFGGPDKVANLVAATKHNNSEQLILEGALYGFRDEPGVSVRVGATVLQDTYLAAEIQYDVLLDHNVVYTRTMNASYGAFPPHDLKSRVRADLREHLCAALVARSPCDASPYDAACRTYLQAHLGVGPADMHG